MAHQTSGTPAYIFNRNYKSSFRLNYNHWLVKGVSGYLLHPRIPKPDATAAIADVGAGTGIWLFETAEEVPDTTQLDGFDIASEQFPPKVWWPQNVNLRVHDALTPFPVEYQGKYDIVHARFFLCLLRDDTAELLLENLVSLLKPGGYLQWFEPNANDVKMRQDNPDTSTGFMERQAKIFHKPTPESSYNWLVQMPRMFEKHGLTLEARENHPTPKHLMLLWGQSNMAGYDDLVSSSKIATTAQGGEMVELINGLDQEFRNGVALDTTWLCFVGRKL